MDNGAYGYSMNYENMVVTYLASTNANFTLHNTAHWYGSKHRRR